jgi:hypothetical protein
LGRLLEIFVNIDVAGEGLDLPVGAFSVILKGFGVIFSLLSLVEDCAALALGDHNLA